MSTEEYTKDSAKPCEGCDLDEIDALTCTAKRIQKQSEATNESLKILDPRRDAFKAAKNAYTTAWAAAKADVDAATAKLTPLKKELACRLPEHSRQCLVLRSGRRSRSRSAHAKANMAVAVSTAISTSQSARPTPRATLSGRISELRQKATELDTYFGDLVDEQTELPANAAAAKKLVDTLAADAAADTGEKGLGQALRPCGSGRVDYRQSLGRLHQRPNYLDCLCQILTCLLRAWKAIVVLEGAQAELSCKDGAKRSAATR